MVEANSGEILASLELIVTEFFYPTTNNERKREIEAMLESFVDQPSAWKHCLYFIDKSSNQYVSMFAYNTIENFVLKKSHALSVAENTELKNFLWTHLTTNHHKWPSYIRNKLVKIIVEMSNHQSARTACLYESLELLKKGGQTGILGLLLLRDLTEVLDNVGDRTSRISYEHRLNLESTMIVFVKRIFKTITGLLVSMQGTRADDYDDDGYSPDPPPSPEREDGLLPTHQASLQTNMLSTRHTAPRYGAFTEVAEECISLCLNIMQNMFVWVPLTSIDPAYISIVFFWVNPATQKQFGEEICITALSVANELLYRRMSPPGVGCTARFGRSATRLLRYLTTTANLSIHSSQYIDKVSEFLRLFFSMHFRRLDAEPDFDNMTFLSLLFQYTFQLPWCSSFLLCIDVWLQFIGDFKPQDPVKYSDALGGLVNGVLNKIQFQHNSDELSQLDNEIVDDDGETEWQSFLRQCIECIAKVGEIAPLNIFNLVLEVWKEAAGAYAAGSITRQQLQDLASLTQLLGRLIPTLFQDDDVVLNKLRTSKVDYFLESLLAVMGRVTTTDPQILRIQPQPMQDAFVQVYAETLACVGAVVPYVTKESVQPGPLLRAAVPLLMPPTRDVPQMAPVLSHAAAHLLLSVAVSLRASDPLIHLREFFTQASHSLVHLQPKTAAVVRQALCVMVLESPGAHASERGVLCATLIEGWCTPLLSGAPSNVACATCLPMLAALLKYFEHHATQTKKLLSTAVERPVQAALVAFQNSNGDSKVSSLVLELFLALLGSLHQQLGASFVHQSISMFMDVAKRQEQGALHRLLQVLQLGVEGGALAGERALAEVLELCLANVLPLVQADNADPDVTLAFFQLAGSILLTRWQHFYSSCVRLGWSPQAGGAEGEGARPASAAHFLSLLTAMAASFRRADHIEVFRLNLQTLDKLNSRWKLYQKAVFKQELLQQLLSVLLGALVQRTAAACLLQEEVASAVHALAAVDFAAYFTAFLPPFLATLPCLRNEDVITVLNRRQDTDVPSFTSNLVAMVNDIQYYQMKG